MCSSQQSKGLRGVHPSAQEHSSRECLGSSGQEHTPGRVFQKAPVLTMGRRALPTSGWNQDRRGAPWPTPVRPIALWLTRRRCGYEARVARCREPMVAGSPWWSETCFGNVCTPGLVSWAQGESEELQTSISCGWREARLFSPGRSM